MNKSIKRFLIIHYSEELLRIFKKDQISKFDEEIISIYFEHLNKLANGFKIIPSTDVQIVLDSLSKDKYKKTGKMLFDILLKIIEIFAIKQ